jgi:hypothetical protein
MQNHEVRVRCGTVRKRRKPEGEAGGGALGEPVNGVLVRKKGRRSDGRRGRPVAWWHIDISNQRGWPNAWIERAAAAPNRYLTTRDITGDDWEISGTRQYACPVARA